MKDPFDDGSVLYLDYINIHMLIVTIVLQDSNSRGTQVKGILSVLHLIIAGESTIVSK